MVVQDKNMGEFQICVDLTKMNDACMHDPFLTPFTDEVLEGVGGQEMYSFMDGFPGYHQIRITKEDRHKTTFVTGLFSAHRDAFWVEECACNIFLGCCHCIQIFYLEVPTSLYG